MILILIVLIDRDCILYILETKRNMDCLFQKIQSIKNLSNYKISTATSFSLHDVIIFGCKGGRIVIFSVQSRKSIKSFKSYLPCIHNLYYESIGNNLISVESNETNDTFCIVCYHVSTSWLKGSNAKFNNNNNNNNNNDNNNNTNNSNTPTYTYLPLPLQNVTFETKLCTFSGRIALLDQDSGTVNIWQCPAGDRIDFEHYVEIGFKIYPSRYQPSFFIYDNILGYVYEDKLTVLKLNLVNTSTSKSVIPETSRTFGKKYKANDKISIDMSGKDTIFQHNNNVNLIDATKSILCKNIYSITFFMVVSIIGMGTSLVEGLVFLFFVHDLKATNTVCGISVLITVMFEVPIFYYSDFIVKKVSNQTLMGIAHIAYVCRVVGYTVIPNPWWLLVLEPLHGVTYACFQLSSVAIASKLANNKLQSTTQGLRSSFLNFGAFIGYVIGGIVMERFNSNILYRVMAGIVLLTLILYMISSYYFENEEDGNISMHSKRNRTSMKHVAFITLNTVGEEDDDDDQIAIKMGV